MNETHTLLHAAGRWHCLVRFLQVSTAGYQPKKARHSIYIHAHIHTQKHTHTCAHRSKYSQRGEAGELVEDPRRQVRQLVAAKTPERLQAHRQLRMAPTRTHPRSHPDDNVPRSALEPSRQREAEPTQTVTSPPNTCGHNCCNSEHPWHYKQSLIE